MQAVNNAHAFDAQYGGTPESRAKYFNASLMLLFSLRRLIISRMA